MAAIQAGQIENGVARDGLRALAAAAAPTRTWRGARFGGELCSFFFAFTDEFLPGLDAFLGAPIRNGFHVPSVPPSPGERDLLRCATAA